MSTTTKRPQQGAKDAAGYRPRTAADHLPRPEQQERSIGRGLLALLGLLVLVVGVPVGLVLWVGNPLPTSAPSLDWLTAPITAEALINIVAVLVWLVWAHFVVCLLAEWRAVRAGRLPGLVPGGGGSQLVARRLIAGVLLLAGTATMTGNAPGQSGAPVASVVSTADAGAASATGSDLGVVLGSVDGRAGAGGGSSSELEAGAEADSTRGEAKVTKFYEVKPPQGRNHDTLWDIADRSLGDPFRYKEIYELNKDRVQPDGRRLVDADLIQPGWQLIMPADASGADITTVRAHVPAATPVATPTTAEQAGERLAEAASTSTTLVSDVAGAAGGGAADLGPRAATTGSGATEVSETPAGSGAEVDLGDLALGGGMVLAGLALALSSRRGAYGDPSEHEQALRLAADGGRAELLDRSLRLLADGRRQQGQALPDASAVYVNDEQVIVHLAGADAPGRPPAPWQESEEGRVWVLRATDIAGLSVEGPAPWPGLVNVAMSHGFDLLVDLEYAPGLVSIGGDPEVAREMALSTVVDLVTHPWSDGTRVTLVGFAGEEALSELAPGRIRQVRTIEEVVDLARRDVDAHAALLRSLGVDGVLAGRSAGSGDRLQPHVVVLSGNPSPEQAQKLTQLLAGGRTGLAVLCVGQTLAARWRFAVDSSGALDLGVLGLSGSARRLRHADLATVARWVRAAQVDATEATARTAALSPAAAVATLPEEGRPLLEAATPMQDRAAALAHVGLLGPVVVQARGQVNLSREELLTELITLVALHPGGVHDSVLRVSLWPRGVEDDVVEATLAAAIAWLGDGPDGAALLDRDEAGRWRLDPAVHVDWLELAAVAQRREDDAHRLAEVLGLARGQAFSGTSGHRYSWLAFHQAARDARVVITAAARRAASSLAGEGDHARAERTLRDGLILVPQAQALWRDLLRLVGGGEGGPEAAVPVVHEMVQTLGSDQLEPQTVALVQHLTPDLRELG